MSGVLPPSRRRILGQALAASAIFGISGLRAHAGESAPHPETIFSRYMVRGPYTPKVANPLSFTMTEQKRDLLVRVAYPDPAADGAPTTFPVVVFSHGEFASKDHYNAVADHWASHGIIVILPTHRDSESLGYMPGRIELREVLAGRVGDLAFLLDQLDAVADEAPALAGRIDMERIALGGHGIGVLGALALAGLEIKLDPKKSASKKDERVKAIISYNGVGPFAFIDDDWSAVQLPVFAAAGTADPGTFGDNFIQSWRWRLSPYTLTSGRDRYGLSLTLADHSYGGLICHTHPSDKPDATGLAIVNAMSSAFVDAHLVGDPTVRTFMKTADLPALTEERAFLERA
jgi:predicted dienelactone hydrolase